MQPPALLSEALRLLTLSQPDRNTGKNSRVTAPDALLGIISNLFTFSADPYGESRADIAENVDSDYREPNPPFVPHRRSTVYITNTINITGPDRTVAVDYIFQHSSLTELCEANASVAKTHGRYDHERLLRNLGAAVSVAPSMSVVQQPTSSLAAVVKMM